MGAQRKSTAELERKGAFDKNPARGRARAAEPVPLGTLGPPPESFLSKYDPGPQLLAAWHELVEESKEVLITSADRGHFEMTCRLRVRCRRSGAKTGDFAQLNKYQSQLGLNPASRSLVNAVGVKTSAEEEDEWEEAASGSTGLRILKPVR
jgi:hypothetical protein